MFKKVFDWLFEKNKRKQPEKRLEQERSSLQKESQNRIDATVQSSSYPRITNTTSSASQCFNIYAHVAEENRRAQGLKIHDMMPHENYVALIYMFYCIVLKHIPMSLEEFQAKQTTLDKLRLGILKKDDMIFFAQYKLIADEFEFMIASGLNLKELTRLYMLAYGKILSNCIENKEL